MCFHLFLASPLTLSEVRSMLPSGLQADLAGTAEQQRGRRLFPQGQTVCRIIHGACSCDLVVQRHPITREDESRLRDRYRRMGLTRDRIIAALELHRRAAASPPKPEGHWPRALAAFAAEHARNAGPSLYYLEFSPDPSLEGVDPERALRLEVRDAVQRPGDWLPEHQAVILG